MFAKTILKSERFKIAILPIESRGSLRLSDARKITYFLNNEFQNMLEFVTMDMALVENILRENNLDIYACSTLNCETEAGKVLGVDYLVNGIVEKRGTNFILEIRLVSVMDGDILNTVNTVIRGNFRELENYMGIVAKRLVGSSYESSRRFVLAETQPQIVPMGPKRTSTWIITGLVLASSAGLGMFFLNRNNDNIDLPKGQPVPLTPLPGPPSFP